MVRTNDKRVREAMQRHVLSFYKGNGGTKALVDQMEHLIDRRPDAYRYATPKTPYQAGLEMAKGGLFLVYNVDIMKFLHRLGFTDDKRLEKYSDGADLYFPMCARACEEIYKEYMKKHPSALRTARGY